MAGPLKEKFLQIGKFAKSEEVTITNARQFFPFRAYKKIKQQETTRCQTTS